MNATTVSLLIFACLAAAVLLGRGLRRLLPESYLSAESRDAIKLAVGLIATMSALLLGLLVSSAKATYDTQRGEVIALAARLSLLNRILVFYGPEALEARAALRASAVDALRRMWPEQADVQAELAPATAAGDAVYAALHRLSPADDLHRDLKAQALRQTLELAEIRALLYAQSVTSVARPLLVAVAGWLLVIFFGFSLVAPPNTATTVAFLASSLSVAVAIFLVLELDGPFGGWIKVPAGPLQQALHSLDA